MFKISRACDRGMKIFRRFLSTDWSDLHLHRFSILGLSFWINSLIESSWTIGVRYWVDLVGRASPSIFRMDFWPDYPLTHSAVYITIYLCNIYKPKGGSGLGGCFLLGALPEDHPIYKLRERRSLYILVRVQTRLFVFLHTHHIRICIYEMIRVNALVDRNQAR